MKLLSLSLGLLPIAAVAADTNALTLIPPYGELPPTFWEQHGLVMVCGAVGFITLAATGIWLAIRPKPVCALPPEQIARAALARFQSQPEDSNLLSEVSQILRRYISQRFNLLEGELTTTEFTRNLAQADNISLELVETLCSFLRECDRRKFSPANSSEPMNAARRALELVEQAEISHKKLEAGKHE